MYRFAGIWIDRNRAIVACIDRYGATTVKTIVPEGKALKRNPFRDYTPDADLLDHIGAVSQDDIVDDVYLADQVYRMNQWSDGADEPRSRTGDRRDRFLAHVVASVSAADRIAVFGPDDARRALCRALRRDPQLRHNIVAVENTEIVSDGEFADFVRKYFGASAARKPLKNTREKEKPLYT